MILNRRIDRAGAAAALLAATFTALVLAEAGLAADQVEVIAQTDVAGTSTVAAPASAPAPPVEADAPAVNVNAAVTAAGASTKVAGTEARASVERDAGRQGVRSRTNGHPNG